MANVPDPYVREIDVTMKAKGVGVRELSEKTGFSKNTIYDWLNGKKGVRSGNAAIVMKYLNRKKDRTEKVGASRHP